MRLKIKFFGLNEKRFGLAMSKHFKHKNLVPSVKHGESIMVWVRFAASSPGKLAIIDRTLSSELYQKIVQENNNLSVKSSSTENGP